MQSELVEYFIWGLLLVYCYKTGLNVGRLEVLREILARPQEIERIVKKYRTSDDKKETVEKMTVERHGNMIYVYTDAGEFLAQGNSLDDCLCKIEKRFPGRKLKGYISKEQAENLSISAK